VVGLDIELLLNGVTATMRLRTSLFYALE
jgi:hypothetical protein